MLTIEDACVTFNSRGTETIAVQNANLTVNDREFVSILGPSGCGKSTLLMAILGMVELSSGVISVGGTPVDGPGTDRAMVFQEANLLLWRSVQANVEYGMEIRKVAKQVRRQRALDYIDLVGLHGFETFFPRQLSGGMQQRVNLARALATDPELLLLDEPFAALDALTREQMQNELLRIWSSAEKTAVFVTHQVDEAIFLSDRVIVMSSRPGRIIGDIAIDLPRPRNLSIKQHPDFVAYEREVGQLLRPGDVQQPVPDDVG